MGHRFWLGTIAACGLALLTSCAPSPRVLRGYVAGQRSLAEQAAAEHERRCTRPPSPAAVFPEPPPTADPPARCGDLLSCLDDTKDAARLCVGALKVAGGRGYRPAALSCQEEHVVALRQCGAAGLQVKGGAHAPR